MIGRGSIWTVGAVLGIAVAVALGWSASQLAGQRIGLAGQPVAVASGLAPSPPAHGSSQSESGRHPADSEPRRERTAIGIREPAAAPSAAPAAPGVAASAPPPAQAPSVPATTPAVTQPAAHTQPSASTAAQHPPARHGGGGHDDSSDGSPGGGGSGGGGSGGGGGPSPSGSGSHRDD
jgi:uncharacterized membrane protein YgcG